MCKCTFCELSDGFYQYVGCYKNDGKNRLLSDNLGKDNDMSPLLCFTTCTFGERRGRFNYFGTQVTLFRHDYNSF